MYTQVNIEQLIYHCDISKEKSEMRELRQQKQNFGQQKYIYQCSIYSNIDILNTYIID